MGSDHVYEDLVLRLSALPIDSATALLTCIAGALILLLVFRRSSLSHAKTSSVKPVSSSAPANSRLRVATIDPSRLNAPNYGYDDVRVSKLLIHPIKSCRGISVQSARYTPEGLENDRLWSIVDAETKAVLTARDFAKMVLITPRIDAEKGVLNVSFPDDSGCESFEVPLRPSEAMMMTWQSIEVTLWGSTIDSRVCEAVNSTTDATAILSAYFGKPVYLVYKSQRPRVCDPTDAFPVLKATTVYQDGYPILFLSEESMGVIEDETRGQVGIQGVDESWRKNRMVIERFRPNIIFHGGGPFAEDLWEEIGIVNETTSTTIPSFLVVSKCARCLLPNVSPETGIRDKAVPYKVLMKIRVGIDPKQKWKACVGCNGVPLQSGTVSVRDKSVLNNGA
ncbi:MOSC N-terminal beta barrel domain-containing protein [Mucidula mucida]|nr:MOSC N-terminal beta barrel domain-containing protein [Mucidula mucida]